MNLPGEEKPVRNSKSDGLLQRAPLPPSIESGPYEEALGKLTIGFSWLHFQLEAFAWKLWKLELSTGTVITKDLQTKHLVEKLQQSAGRAIPKAADLREFQSILKRVTKVAEKRNELLHSLWSFNSESATRFSKKRVAIEVSTSIDEIKALNKEITSTAAELYEFEKRDPLELPPLALALKEYIKRKRLKDK